MAKRALHDFGLWQLVCRHSEIVLLLTMAVPNHTENNLLTSDVGLLLLKAEEEEAQDKIYNPSTIAKCSGLCFY